MKDNYFSELTTEELENLCRNANRELTSRREQERKEDWKKVVDILQFYIKKYGEIIIDCEHDADVALDSDTTFPEVGTIHPAFYY